MEKKEARAAVKQQPRGFVQRDELGIAQGLRNALRKLGRAPNHAVCREQVVVKHRGLRSPESALAQNLELHLDPQRLVSPVGLPRAPLLDGAGLRCVPEDQVEFQVVVKLGGRTGGREKHPSLSAPVPAGQEQDADIGRERRALNVRCERGEEIVQYRRQAGFRFGEIGIGSQAGLRKEGGCKEANYVSISKTRCRRSNSMTA